MRNGGDSFTLNAHCLTVFPAGSNGIEQPDLRRLSSLHTCRIVGEILKRCNKNRDIDIGDYNRGMSACRVCIDAITPRGLTALRRSDRVRVLGRFAGGLYLDCTDDILALTASTILLTPLSARLTADSALPDLQPGETFDKDRLDLGAAQAWSPRPDWSRFDVDAFVHAAAEALREADALLRREAPAVLAAATGPLPEALLGLGPGLTPAGDDVLVGRLLARHAGLTAAPWPAGAVERLLGLAESRTTRLSLAFLRAAAAWECGEAWHALGPGSGSRAEAIRVILGTGQTSGAAALWGFLTAGEAATNDASQRHDPGLPNR